MSRPRRGHINNERDGLIDAKYPAATVRFGGNSLMHREKKKKKYNIRFDFSVRRRNPSIAKETKKRDKKKSGYSILTAI